MYFISKYFYFVLILASFQISSTNRLTGLLSRLLKGNQPVILVVEESQIPKVEVAKSKSQDLNQLFLDYRDESQAVPSGNVKNLDLLPNIQIRQSQVLLLKKPKESRTSVKNRLYEPLIQQLLMLRSGNCKKNIECQSECQEEPDVDDCNDDCNKKFDCPAAVEEKPCGGNDCDKEPSNECAESGDNCQDGGSTKGYKEVQLP